VVATPTFAGRAVIITFVAATIVKAWVKITVAIVAAACCSKALNRYAEVRHSALVATVAESVVKSFGWEEAYGASPASIIGSTSID